MGTWMLTNMVHMMHDFQLWWQEDGISLAVYKMYKMYKISPASQVCWERSWHGTVLGWAQKMMNIFILYIFISLVFWANELGGREAVVFTLLSCFVLFCFFLGHYSPPCLTAVKFLCSLDLSSPNLTSYSFFSLFVCLFLCFLRYF